MSDNELRDAARDFLRDSERVANAFPAGEWKTFEYQNDWFESRSALYKALEASRIPTPPAPDAAGLAAALEDIKREHDGYTPKTRVWLVANEALYHYRTPHAAGQPNTGTSQPVYITGRGFPGMDLKFARQHLDGAKGITLGAANRELLFAVENILDYLQDADAKERHT